MIHIKLLSGDTLSIEVSGEGIQVGALKARMDHPFPVFFLDEKELDYDYNIPMGETVSVLFQSYRSYYVWSGCNNSFWPGDFDKIYCYDLSEKKTMEWDHRLLKENDALVVDYLSFGLFQPHHDEIKSILHVDFLPIDLDLQTIKNILMWRERAKTDSRRLDFLEFASDYFNPSLELTKIVWLFRVTDAYARTPLQWMNRLTEQV